MPDPAARSPYDIHRDNLTGALDHLRRLILRRVELRDRYHDTQDPETRGLIGRYTTEIAELADEITSGF